MKSSICIMKKPLVWIAILLIPVFVTTQIATVKTATETEVRVKPFASVAKADETFTVNITLTDVQNLYGVEVTLCWNASILKIVSVDIRLGVESYSDGVLHKPLFIAENKTNQDEGQYFLAGTSYAPALPFNGSGNIVRITFKVTNTGDSNIDLESKLSDWPPPDREPRISWPIEHTTIDGFFDMNKPTIGIPTRTPSNNVLPEQSVKVSVNITDSASGVKNATLFYTINNGTSWKNRTMNYNASTYLYEATIPSQPAGTWVKLKIIAYDYAENLQIKNGEDTSCTYWIIPEFSNTTILLLFMFLTIFAIALSHKKFSRGKVD